MASVSPQCVADLRDVTELLFSLNSAAAASTPTLKKTALPPVKQAALVKTLVAAAMCFHLDDNSANPFACTVCIDHRARLRFPPGSRFLPPRIPNVVHRAVALRKTLVWLHANIDHGVWRDSNEMGSGKIKRAALLDTMDPSSTLLRTLDQIVAMATETDQERRERPMHYMAARSLYMGYCACTALAPNSVVMTAGSGGSGGAPAHKAKKSKPTMSAARRAQYSETSMRRNTNRGRIMRARNYSSNCARLKSEILNTLQGTSQEDTADAKSWVPKPINQTGAVSTLTIIQALLVRDEALCRILLACSCLLGVAFAATVAEAPDEIPAWNKTGRSMRPPASNADRQAALDICNATEPPARPQLTFGDQYPITDAPSVFTMDGCTAKASYGKPSPDAAGAGFRADAVLLPAGVGAQICGVLRIAHNSPWSVVFPVFVSSLVAVMCDYASDRFSKRLHAGTQDHYNGMRAVVDFAKADRSLYFQRVIGCLSHGGLDVEEAKEADDVADAESDVHTSDPHADVVAVLRAVFATLEDTR